MSNNKQTSVDAYCNSCDAFICDELVTFEETCSNCGTDIEYFENEMRNKKQSSVEFYSIESKKLSIKAIQGEITFETWILMENELSEQAKAIRKEEIKEAFNYIKTHPYSELDAEQYYNETFGDNK